MIEHRNPHLDKLDIDYLYHLGLDSSMNLEEMFGDTKFVCMGGSADRSESFAKKFAKEIGVDENEVKPIGKTERFSLFKVNEVIFVNHGMGMPSMSILLNEITKLMEYAGSEDYKFIRVGTSGGVGVEPGTVIVTEEGLNNQLSAFYKKEVLGGMDKWPTQLNEEMTQGIMACRGEIDAMMGKTLGTNDFYLGQGRMDGALNPSYSAHHVQEYLGDAYNEGVRNIEMESTEFAGFCLKAGIPAAIVCAALLNRLEGDQVTSTPEELAQFSDNAERIVINYIRNNLEKVNEI